MPSPTFNEGHPDPNLTYADELVSIHACMCVDGWMERGGLACMGEGRDGEIHGCLSAACAHVLAAYA